MHQLHRFVMFPFATCTPAKIQNFSVIYYFFGTYIHVVFRLTIIHSFMICFSIIDTCTKIFFLL